MVSRSGGRRVESATAASPPAKKNRSGPSGWPKFNQKRKETGVRPDFVSKATVRASTIKVERGAAEAATLPRSSKGTKADEATTQTRSCGGTKADDTTTQKSDEATTQQRNSGETQTDAPQLRSISGAHMSVGPTAGPTAAPQLRSIAVGEHLTGEPFIWQSIFDLP